MGHGLKTKHEYKQQKFTAFQNAQRARNHGTTVCLHALILTLMSAEKFHFVSVDSPDLKSVKSRLNISQLN